MSSVLLDVDNLVKHYPGVKAVNGVSFKLQQGTCFGLLGPNGAGKTTTIEILEGIQEKTSGDIRYKGQSIHSGKSRKQFRNETGIMFQSTALQDFITVRETLDMFARFYPQTASIDTLVQRCNLTEYLQQDNRKLSGGQRQRLLLAIALVNNPDLLFLDEPTTGLDPQARRNFWDLVESIKAEGKTILLTTHYMDEAYELCDEIAIMDHGKIIAHGSPKSLLTTHFDDVILQIPQDAIATDCKLLEHAHQHKDMFEFTTSDVNQTISDLLAAKVPLTHLRIRSRNLDDLFLELTGKELRA